MIIDGTREISYSHLIKKDDGRNKPFEQRTVTVELSYYPSNFAGDIDSYVATVQGGDFHGMYCSGDNYQDAIYSLQYKLMDESRKSI